MRITQNQMTVIFREALNKDQDEIKSLWKKYFAFDDGGFTNFFFKHRYQECDNYLLENKEGEIVSCLSVSNHQLFLKDRLYSYSFIIGVITKQQFQGQGNMSLLMEKALEVIESDIVIIQGYIPDIYRKFGFKDYFSELEFTMDKLLPVTKSYSLKVSDDYTIVLDAYNKYVSKFNAYKHRSLKDVEDLKIRNKMMDCQLEYCLKDGIVVGYLISNGAYLEEIVYDNQDTLFMILNSVFQRVGEFKFVISSVVDYYLLDKYINYTKKDRTLIIFNQLNEELDQEAFKDLYFNEYE